MPIRSVSRLALAAALLLAAPLSGAETALKPVPTPDVSKLPAARADEVRRARADFDKTRDILTGDALAENYGLLAAAYARNGFADAAVVALDDAITLAPHDPRWIYARGVLALGAKQDALAAGYFERAIAANPSYLPPRAALASQKIGAGDLDGARRLLDEYTARAPDEAVPYALLGDIALRQKRYADAIKHYQHALRLDPAATKLYASLAQAYADSGDAKAAADARAKAGNGVPTLADLIGGSLLGGAAAPAAAAPVDPKTQAINEVLAALAARQYAAARSHLDAALQRAPNDANLLALYARVEAAAGDLAAAQARVAAAIAADPKNVLARLNQGYVLEMKGDDAGAERAYGEALRLDPQAGAARFALGRLLMRNGRNDDAVTQLRGAVAADPADRMAWTHLVAAEVVKGDCAGALKDINGGLAKNAHEPYLLQLFVRVASTCSAANAAEKRMALDYGGKLYGAEGGGDSAPIGEAYALALAANGRWDDAVKTQQAAMFVLVRNGGTRALTPYRAVLDQLRAHQLPDRPWPASAQVYRPERMAPDPAPAAPASKK